MSVSTIRRASGLSSRELNQGGTSTSAQQFKTTNNSGPLICYIPGSGAIDKVRFRVNVAGRILSGSGTPNFTCSIYFGISATVSSNTIMATTGAVAIATTQGNFSLTSDDCFWDSTSQRLCGITKGYVYATVVAQAINTGILTSVDLSTATSSEGQGFTIAGTFSAGHASHAAYVDVFEITIL